MGRKRSRARRSRVLAPHDYVSSDHCLACKHEYARVTTSRILPPHPYAYDRHCRECRRAFLHSRRYREMPPHPYRHNNHCRACYLEYLSRRRTSRFPPHDYAGVLHCRDCFNLAAKRRYAASLPPHEFLYTQHCRACRAETYRRRGGTPGVKWLRRYAPDLPFVCAVGTDPNPDTVDHIIPLSRGGTDDVANLRYMCSWHNISRGAARLTDDSLRQSPCAHVLERRGRIVLVAEPTSEH